MAGMTVANIDVLEGLWFYLLLFERNPSVWRVKLLCVLAALFPLRCFAILFLAAGLFPLCYNNEVQQKRD